MKRFFTKNGLWILSAIAIFVLVLCVMASIGNGNSFLRNAFNVIAQPIRAAGSAIVHQIEDVRDHFDDISDLQQENEELRQKIAELETEIQNRQSDADENARLRSLLSLREKHSNLTFEDATIIARATSNWESAMTLNRGTDHGISVGNCAVDAYGNLVGVVTDVGSSWCTVTTILDTSSEIGALIFRTASPAVAAGDFSLMTEGLLKLEYLTDSEKLINGDLVVTSGLGGYYPSGLNIGTVKEIRTDDSGMVRYAVLSPKTDLDHLSEIFLITEFDVVE